MAMDSESAKKITADLSDAFFVELARICAKHKMAPADLLVVMQKESGVSPKSINSVKDSRTGQRTPVAIGLIQFTKITLPGLGLTQEAWESMWSWTAEEQLPYVDKYFQGVSGFRNKAPYENATQVYQAVFAPATMRASFDGSQVLYKAPSKAYEMNAQLDVEKKGWIQLSDMTRFLQGAASSNRVKACLQRMIDLGLDPFSRDESFFFATYGESEAFSQAIPRVEMLKPLSLVAVGLGAALVYLGDEIANALEDAGYARSARFFRAL